MKENKNENVCESNFDGRFFGELCWKIVQQFTSEGPLIVSEGYPTDSPRRVVQYIYRISVVSFREQKAFVLKTGYFTRIRLRHM